MDSLGFLIAAAALVLAIVAYNKIGTLEAQIRHLKMQLGLFADEMVKLSGQREAPAPETPAPEAAAPETLALAEAPPPPEQPIITEAPANANWPETAAPPPPAAALPRGDMEQALASRWFVWIGGVAIAIGGLLFVKYAYDNGLISPALQVFLGLVVGAALVAAGEFVRRQGHADGTYVPAALSATGLATAFAAIYAGYDLYEIIGSLTAFVCLALIALGAFALSRLQGPFIAALGLLGSYATPAMIPSEHPSAWSFFTYLLIIAAAAFATLRGRTWWWLGYGTLGLGLIWALLWITGGPFETDHTLPIGLFALASAALAFFALKGRAILDDESGTLWPNTRLTHPLGIALAGLVSLQLIAKVLVHETAHAPLALMVLSAAAAVFLALAWAKRGLALLAPLAGLLVWLSLMVWPEAAFHTFAMDERGLWTSVIGADAPRFLTWMLGAGAVLMLTGLAGTRLQASRAWPLLAAATPVLFLAGAWGRVDSLMSDTVWMIFGAAAAAVLLAASFLQHDEEEANWPAGFLAAGAAALLVFAADRLFDNIWLTLAIATLATLYSFGANVLRNALMGPIASTLASFTVLRLFISRELWQEQRDLPLGQHWVLYGYGLPAVLFWLASRALKQAGHLRSAVALEGLALGLALSLASLELRVLINGNIVTDEPGLLEMAAHILTWAGAAYGLMYRQRLFSSFISLWGARVLVAAAVAGIVLLSLGKLNPLISGDPVIGNALFNSLTLAYLAPVPLLGAIAWRLRVIGWENFRPALGLLTLLLGFTFVTLQTKFMFQGRLLEVEAQSVAESYAYSAVWLLFAFALFAAGIRLSRQYVRYAGLGVMVLVVLKVFLWDMSSLEGLYRIASFVGLGLCLVGIGWLYQRFVQGRATAA